MSDRYPIQIRWDARIKRYIARCAYYPDLIVHAMSRHLAEKQMRDKIAEIVAGESNASHR